MREIKFRAWDKNAKKMIFGGSFIDVSQTPGVDRWVFGMDIFNHPDDVELLQFTGLKDKNGIEIYEGDIVDTPLIRVGKTVKYGSQSCKVIWYQNGFYLQDDSGIVYSLYDYATDQLEVIGNIYENPNLLGESNVAN